MPEFTRAEYNFVSFTLSVLQGEGKQVLINSGYLAPYVSMDRLR